MTYLVSETLTNCERLMCETTDRSVVDKIVATWVEDETEDGPAAPAANSKMKRQPVKIAGHMRQTGA